jgi:hypothetical protein
LTSLSKFLEHTQPAPLQRCTNLLSSASLLLRIRRSRSAGQRYVVVAAVAAAVARVACLPRKACLDVAGPHPPRRVAIPPNAATRRLYLHLHPCLPCDPTDRPPARSHSRFQLHSCNPARTAAGCWLAQSRVVERERARLGPNTTGDRLIVHVCYVTAPEHGGCNSDRAHLPPELQDVLPQRRQKHSSCCCSD